MFKSARQHLFALVVTVIAVTSSGAFAQDATGFRLLMIEQAGCYYCRVFNRDVAPVYDTSVEGTAAPLIRADLRGELPEGVTLASLPFVTPTFILLDPTGAEVERLTGYPGDDFFWPYIGDMLVQAGALPAVN
jgi:thioredoxin-related protein